jgi:DNA-3-methyladenine glycosylase
MTEKSSRSPDSRAGDHDHGEFSVEATEKSPRSWTDGGQRAPTVLAREFFDRPAPEVAPDLLGCLLWHASPAGTVAAVITEVEAYAGLADPASHAYRGQTARNAVMFGPPGHAYVYFTYGMHFCVNLVCQPAGEASAVLLRAGRVTEGAGLAAARRLTRRGRAGRDGTGRDGTAGGPAELEAAARGLGARDAVAGGAAGRPLGERDLARGPARLCQALGIDRSLDGADVCAADSPLAVGARTGGRPAAPPVISTGPRVGISQAAEVPWRFWLAGDPSVSTYRRSAPRRVRG